MSYLRFKNIPSPSQPITRDIWGKERAGKGTYNAQTNIITLSLSQSTSLWGSTGASWLCFSQIF